MRLVRRVRRVRRVRFTTSNITTVTATIASGQSTATTPACPPGMIIIGGGVTQTDIKDLRESGPVGTTQWRASFANSMAAGKSATVTAYCAG